eukprot:3242007-Pyramimonas_sp.AAC.1
MASLLRRGANEVPCAYIRFLVPMDLHPGCTSVESICDLWWHELLGDKWPGMTRNVEFHPQPLEFISPGPAGPRHELRGLAIFTISSSLLRQAPRVRDLEVPILSTAALPTYFMDFPSAVGPEVMHLLHGGLDSSAAVGRIYRSPGHATETPRGRVEIRFANHTSSLTRELLMRRIRGRLPVGVCFASVDLFTDAGSLLAEVGHADAINTFWNMCSGAIFLAKSTVLLTTESAPETWQTTMDAMLRNDTDSAILKLRHRPSRHGGRHFATPSALPARLAATRRAKQTRGGSTTLQAITDVEIKGHLHADEHAL